MNDFRETLYTVDARGRRKWVYPAVVEGFFRKKRAIVAAILVLIYISLPWIRVAEEQAVFLDFVHRRFVLFGATFWATDTQFLFLVLIILGLSLFFFTAIFGRVWCGWACPETVFLEFVFRPIETFIEGNVSQRKKLDAEPWSLKKLRIKGAKYFIFALIAWILSSTALAYFIGREPLLQMMSDYPWNNLGMFLLTLALMGALLFQFGWFREQFCTVLCPYARFQSVLLDADSLLVGYDYNRGEPRGKASDSGKGDCIDCGLCVKVCPTGIDIRNGLQLECVQCAACADACDSVMVKIGRSTGLVRYDTEHGLQGARKSFLRPRVIIYGSILVCLVSFFAYSLNTRVLHYASLLHAKDGAVFTTLENGEISNRLTLNLENKSKEPVQYTLTVGPEVPVKMVMPINPYPLGPDTHQSIPVFVNFDKVVLQGGKRKITFTLTDGKDFTKTLTIDLLGPG